MTGLAYTAPTTANDSLLRFGLRADAILTGVTGVALLPFASSIAELCGTTVGFERAVAAFFVVYGVAVLAIAAQPSLKRLGMAVIVGNFAFTVGAVALVLSDVFALTTTGVVATLGSGVYTLAFGELQ